MYKQKFSALLHAIVNVWGKDDEMFEMVGDALKAFGNYVMSVYEMETRIMLLRFRCDDPAEYQDEVISGTGTARRPTTRLSRSAPS